jgi:hypothetical protein
MNRSCRIETRPGDAGIVWLKLSVLYLLVGVGIGIAMGASQNFTLRPVHAHVNLLGWTTLALAGVIYSVFPDAGSSLLARIHFWTMNIALPVMMLALAYLLVSGDRAVIPVLGAAEIMAALSVLSFAANLFLNLRSD